MFMTFLFRVLNRSLEHVQEISTDPWHEPVMFWLSRVNDEHPPAANAGLAPNPARPAARTTVAAAIAENLFRIMPSTLFTSAGDHNPRGAFIPGAGRCPSAGRP